MPRDTVYGAAVNSTVTARNRETDEDPVALVDRRFDERRKWVFEREWFLSLAYFVGLQWVEYNDAARRLDIPSAPSWRVRHVANHLIPIVQLILGTLTKNKPDQTVVPATPEEKDVNAAKAAGRYLNYLWRKLHMDGKVRQMLMWSCVTGSAFLKVYWDNEAGTPIPIKRDEQRRAVPVKDGEEPDETVPLGEVGVDVLSPFEVVPDPSARTLEECQWFMCYRARDVKWIKRVYGKDVTPEGDISNWNMYDARVLNLTGSGEQLLKTEELLHSAVVKEMWFRPTDEYPDGRLLIVASGQVLHDGPNPYPELRGDLPFVMHSYQEVPGRFWPMGVVEPLLPMQRQYNRAVSDVIENKNLMARPKWKAPKGSLRFGAITSEPGEIVEYVPVGGAVPEMVQMPNLPAYAMALPSQINSDMYTVSGQINFAGGMTGMRMSAMMMSLVMEQQTARMGAAAAEMEEAIERVGRLELACIKANYGEKRTGLLLGKENAWEAIEFDASTLADGCDVVVQSSSALPQDKLAKQQFVLSLHQQGIVTDPTKILRMLDLGEVDELFQDINLDSQFAQYENEQLLKHDMPVEDYQSHAVHIYEHNRYRKTLAFNKKPQAVKDRFAAHVKDHQMMLQEQQQGQTPPAELRNGQPTGGPPRPQQGMPQPGQPLPPMGGAQQGPGLGGGANLQAAQQQMQTMRQQETAQAMG